MAICLANSTWVHLRYKQVASQQNTISTHSSFLLTVECDWTGINNETTWNCCNFTNQCGLGEGDCDYDDQCEGNLTCGFDNCQAMNPNKTFSISADCCYAPSKH